MRIIPWMLLAICGSNAEVSQRVGIVLGLPETFDVRYGIEFSNVGVDISPGLGMIAASKFRNDEVVPFSWNPTIKTSYNFGLKRWVAIKPNISFMYFYGWGGMMTQSCMDCGTLKTRSDGLYFKESLAVEFKFGTLAIEINPGFTQHKIIERTTSEIEFKRRNESEFKNDWIWVSLTFSKIF